MFKDLNKIGSLLTLLGVGIAIYFVFLFNIDISRYRSLQELWNLGHIFLFIVITFYAYKYYLNNLTLSVYSEIIFIAILALVIGLFIEYVQTFTGRNYSYFDVLLDVVGGLIGFIFFSKSISEFNLVQKLITYSSILTLLILTLYPMIIVVLDDFNQRADFPILIKNESVFEVTRFKKNNINIELVNNIDYQDKETKVLKFTFKPSKYSTATLGTFKTDWSEYKYLVFSVYNDKETTSSFVMRIHDSKHEKIDYAYKDRFNRLIKLNNGWNEINICLNDVKNAPANRYMNMKRISQLIIFKNDVNKEQQLYFGKMRLIK